MNKKLNIFGRKVPVLAVIMAVLIIGTASAALIVNYATLTGTYTIDETITVAGDGTTADLIDITDGTAIFTITNKGDATSVNVDTTLYLDVPETMPIDKTMEDYMVTDTTGITITYTPPGTAPDDTSGNYVLVNVPISVGTPTTPVGTPVTVTFVAVPGVVTGDYTIQVEVKP